VGKEWRGEGGGEEEGEKEGESGRVGEGRNFLKTSNKSASKPQLTKNRHIHHLHRHPHHTPPTLAPAISKEFPSK